MADPAGARFGPDGYRPTRPADEVVHPPIIRVAVESSLSPTCEPGESLEPAVRRGDQVVTDVPFVVDVLFVVAVEPAWVTVTVRVT